MHVLEEKRQILTLTYNIEKQPTERSFICEVKWKFPTREESLTRLRVNLTTDGKNVKETYNNG